MSDSTERNEPAATDQDCVLSLRNVTKRYGANTALDGVDFMLRRGEIHAVLGENGAGKSTLMHVIRGLTRPDSGHMEVGGKPVAVTSPDAARRLGIGMVHQHFMLVPSFSVADNLALSEPPAEWRLARLRDSVTKRARSTAARLGWDLDLESRVADLPVGTQQRVEIVRALLGDASIILFDEPTAVLAPTETVELFRVLRGLRDEGRSIIFVSHKLSEVMSLCDRVTVLRRGRVVGVLPVADTSPADLASRMVGSDKIEATTAAVIDLRHDGASAAEKMVFESAESRFPEAAVPVVELRHVSTAHEPNTVELQDVSFTLIPGQILGVAGVDGNGQSELASVLTGMRRWSSGEVLLHGRVVDDIGTQSLADLGIAFIPPDRHREGLALDLSVEENLVLKATELPEFRRGPFLKRRELAAYGRKLADDFDIRADNLSMPVRSLSGGNQQKVVVARALATRPKLIVAASPTRGLDVAATAYIHDRLRERRDEGSAILLISTELDEVIALSDRIAVMSRGRIVDIVAPNTPRSTLGLMMGGLSGAAA